MVPRRRPPGGGQPRLFPAGDRARRLLGTNFRAGNFTTSDVKIGLKSSVAVSVPANSHGSCCTPDAAATASRMGRRTKYPLNTKKKNTNDINIALCSSGFTSTARRSSAICLNWSSSPSRLRALPLHALRKSHRRHPLQSPFAQPRDASCSSRACPWPSRPTGER